MICVGRARPSVVVSMTSRRRRLCRHQALNLFLSPYKVYNYIETRDSIIRISRSTTQQQPQKKVSNLNTNVKDLTLAA